MTPFVSVIIPVYNAEKYLRECLDSVVNQTLRDIEIICVDDGSTDSSPAVLAEYAERDPRVRVVTQENRGVGPARNAGIRAARGEFVAFLDPDDLLPDASVYEALYFYAKENRVRVCGGGVCSLANDGKRYFPDASWGANVDQAFPREGFMRFADWQFDYGFYRYIFERRLLLDDEIFFPPYIRYQDPPFCARALEAAGEFYALRRTTYVFRDWHTPDYTDRRRVCDQLRGIRDLLKFSRERGYAKLHWLQIHRLFEEFKPHILDAARREKEEMGGGHFSGAFPSGDQSVIALLKEIDELAWFPLVWQYKEDQVFHSVKEEFEIADCYPPVEDAPFPQDTVDCAFITDDGYVNMTAVAINSIRRSRAPETKVRIHVVAAALSEYSEKVFRLFEEKDFSVEIIRVEKSVLDKLATLHKAKERGYCMATPAALLKFSLPELLPNLNRVLYLDGDVLVRRDLGELFRTPLGENYAAAVTDAWSLTGDTDIIRRFGKWRFNSGVMLLNLSFMRKREMSAVLIEAKKRSTDFRLMDQPIFNAQFAGNVCLLPLKYNFCPCWYFQNTEKICAPRGKERLKKYTGLDISDSEELLSLDVCIAHFAGTEKPWSNENLPFAFEWREMRRDFFRIWQKAIADGNLKFTPLVSVVIPVYNVEKYLRQCLDSVVNQTLKEIEIICVDDGSTDSSPQILEEYAATDARVKILTQSNKGQGAARNLGIKKASGEYIGFVDSDDYVEPNMYERLWRSAKEKNFEIAECGAVIENEGFASEDYCRGQAASFDFKDWEMLSPAEELFTENRFHAVLWNKIYSRAFLVSCGLAIDETIKKGEDAAFQWCCMPHCSRFRRISDKLYHYRVGRKGSTETQKNTGKDWESFLIGCRRIFAYWEKRGWTKEIGDILFRRFWVLALWRHRLWFGLATGDLFFRRIHEILALFEENGKIDDSYLRKIDEKDKIQILRYFSAEKRQIIVSLTSFPTRIKAVSQAIETILDQTWMPDRVTLWLADSQFPRREAELPHELLALRSCGLEIFWTKDIKSYKKLVPALKAFPHEVIVTADDDLLYPRDWLEVLARAYLKDPRSIQACRAHEISFLDENTLAPYASWEKEIGPRAPSFNNFLTGVGGVLFPPKALHSDVLDESAFTALCPRGDDIWFWAMAARNGTKINVPVKSFPLRHIKGTQEVSLWRDNVDGGENDRALTRVLKAYPEILLKLDRIHISRKGKQTARKEETLAKQVSPKKYPAFLVRLGAMFILNKAARKRWRERHMDLTPKDGIDVNARPELRRDGALKRFVVRVAAMFIFSKKKRDAFRARHLNLTPRDGVDVRRLSSAEQARLRERARAKSALWRVFDAIVPASRGKIAHTERHLRRAAEEQTRILLTELRRSREESNRRFADMSRKLEALQRDAAQGREREEALKRALAAAARTVAAVSSASAETGKGFAEISSRFARLEEQGEAARSAMSEIPGKLSALSELVPATERALRRECASVAAAVSSASAETENRLESLARSAEETRERLRAYTDYRLLADALPGFIEKLRERNPLAREALTDELFASSVEASCVADCEQRFSDRIRAAFSDRTPAYYERVPAEARERELKLWFKLRTGRDLDLKHPKTFNEKIQWLKLRDVSPLKTRLADKFEARAWVREKIGEKYLTPLIGVYDAFDEIDFDALPSRFVMKTTHGSGYNIVVKDKASFDRVAAAKNFSDWLSRKFEYQAGFEMHYADMKPRILIEEFLDIDESGTYEWQAFCFNGEAKFFLVIVGGAHDASPGKRFYYSPTWEKLPFTSLARELPEGEISRPENFAELAACVKKLCDGFLHVRVDFYRLRDGSWKFGEMTFSTASGLWAVYPEEYDRVVGDMLTLPAEENSEK